MKRLAMVLGGAVTALALVVAPAFAGGKAASPNYLPGNHTDVGMFVDMLAGPTAAKPGAQTNFVAPGGSIVFRMWAVDTAGTGKVLTGADVSQAYVKIPGQPVVMLKFAKQGTAANAPSYWTGTWTVPATHPVNTVVLFHVLMRTKADHKLGDFSQDTLAAGSQLTVVTTP
jgi:hypothetical protein